MLRSKVKCALVLKKLFKSTSCPENSDYKKYVKVSQVKKIL